MDEQKEMTLTLRIKSYFNLTNQQTIAEFKNLSDKDRQWFADEFCAMGLPTVRKS